MARAWVEAHQRGRSLNTVTRHSKAFCVISDGGLVIIDVCSIKFLGEMVPRRHASPKGGRVGIFEASAVSRSTCHCVRGGIILVKEEPGRDIFVE